MVNQQNKETEITQKELLDAVDHDSKRKEDETWENYKLRRKISNHITKNYMRGRIVS